MTMSVYPCRQMVRFIGDDVALTAALKLGQHNAQEELYRRYAPHIRGVLVRVLGTNVDVSDHLHNTFIQIFAGIGSIRNGVCLKQWLTRVAVYTAIAHIKSNRRKSWLTFVAPEEIPHLEYHSADDEQREAVYQVYRVLERLTAEDRAIFCLRVIDGMQLKELASVFNWSLATVKRRFSHAQQRFLFHSRVNPALVEWMNRAQEDRRMAQLNA